MTTLDTLSISPVWWALAGFILLAVAGIVRRGVALRAELDEVI